jgi:LAO/AO transport system kinase
MPSSRFDMARSDSNAAQPDRVQPDIADLADAVRKGERRALARAITLVESTRADHRRAAEQLLDALLPDTGRSIRIGITGVPGVGKSTFIERFGLHVIGEGHRIAVLAVDPSSKRGGGSILGDKTRMQDLSTKTEAFIRPSPAGTTLGGVARRTREAMLLCEAAGFDVLVVETVGVGQSETAVADMVDMFLLLLLPGGGDELQGIKRGIVELADLVIVNKADGDMADAAQRTAADYRNALRLLRPPSPDWRVVVERCSALTGDGVALVWQTVLRYQDALGASGAIAARRAGQARAWLWSEVGETLLAALRAHPEVVARIGSLEADVSEGRISPAAGARTLLEAFLGTTGAATPASRHSAL